jgi:hypothetical protein
MPEDGSRVSHVVGQSGDPETLILAATTVSRRIGARIGSPFS